MRYKETERKRKMVGKGEITKGSREKRNIDERGKKVREGGK